ncbi:hypothetical protein ACFOW4_10780 [Micromonospora sp. GCM10011542]|uniref:hypothetical protein n=1 Tax=Micromonospora sp. GCM10011542 TaxID=3317337 RepID=UPI003615CA86
MIAELPRLNPFPAQATTAIEEGPFAESYQRWAGATPTVALQQVRRLSLLVSRFRRSHELGGVSSGQVAYVYGAHGAGKTHAIRAAVGQIATHPGNTQVLPLYVKLDGPDFVQAYRRLMAQLSLSDLTGLALRFLGSLSAVADPSPATADIQDDLRRDPAALLQMFDEHLLERGLLLEAQADRMRDAVRDEKNFQRALTYLLEPALQEAAYDWLLGRQVSEPELRRVGISRQLDTPDQCRYGLQLLTLICERAGRPLVLILDQGEKLLLDAQERVIPEGAGLLHSLVEAVPDLRGMLIVASNDRAWDALPQDLRQRFGANDIVCSTLQPDEARDLVGRYVVASFGAQVPPDYQAPWPFIDAAMRKLLRNSGGNPRILLQLAFQSFDALDTDAKEIDESAVPDNVAVLDREDVDRAIRRVLRRLGPISGEPELGFHYIVDTPHDGRLLIRLSEAMFYTDETERAEEDVAVRLTMPRSVADRTGRLAPPVGIQPRHVLIVIGYASTEVLHLLRDVYDEVLVYRDADSIARALTALIEGAERHGTRRYEQVDFPKLYGELADLGLDRSRDADALRQAILGANRRQVDSQIERRFDELALRWPDERRRLTDRIEAVRARREREELTEIHKVYLTHRQRVWFLASLALLLSTGAAIITLAVSGSLPANLLYLVAMFALALAFLVLVHGNRTRTARAGEPASRAELDRIAAERVRHRGPALWRAPLQLILEVRQLPPWTDLDSRDPYRRYGFVLTRIRADHRRALRSALVVERVAVVRRAMMNALGQMTEQSQHDADLVDVEPSPLPAVPHDAADPADVQLPYRIQHQRADAWSKIARRPPAERLLIALANLDRRWVGRSENTADENATTSAAEGPGRLAYPGVVGQVERNVRGETDPAILFVLDAAKGRGAVGELYDTGLTRHPDLLLDALAEVSEGGIRRAAHLLSPFTPEGLGWHDQLRLATEIERLYLFVEQLLFFRDGGVDRGAA